VLQDAISASDRPHPVHMAPDASSVQIPVQGDAGATTRMKRPAH
jgi:hypothetical protein